MRAILIAASLCLAGCANDANIYPFDPVGQRIVGNETYVSISNVWSEMDALPLAERHCAQYGKRARFDQMVTRGRAAFACVART